MMPSILMNLDFSATEVDAEPPGPGGLLGQLLLLGVGRMIIPFAWLIPFMRIF